MECSTLHTNISEGKCYYLNLGVMDYIEALDLQDKIVEARRKMLIGDVLILLEHPPVFTVGRSGRFENILVPRAVLDREGIPVYRVDRGGDVTYHGPGQLIGYFIFDITDNKDILRFVHKVEQSIIKTLNDYAITAHPERGVWVGDEKIAAIGMRVQEWITKHGFALNVNPNMDHFAMINPCGIKAEKITSMSKLLGRSISTSDIRPRYINHFCGVFSKNIIEISLDELRDQING